MPGLIDFQQLTEFNEDLIKLSGVDPIFDPETIDIIDAVMIAFSQRIDIFKGYLSAQENLLPRLRQGIASKISTEEFLEEINKLHALVGKTLLTKKMVPEKLGCFSTSQIWVWRIDINAFDLILYFSGSHSCKSDPEFVEFFCKKFNLDKPEITKFITFMRKIQTAEIDYSKDGLSNTPEFGAYHIIIRKIITSYHTNALSAEDLEILRPILKFMMHPSQYPTAMQAYADKTLAKFYDCDPNNLEEVTEFLAESFYELTEIHPFADANGRVATCLMNVFLSAFKLPNIVLRGHDEKAYQALFTNISTSRAPLKQAILSRITATTLDENEASVNKIIRLLFVINAGLYDKLLQLLDRKYDIKKLLKKDSLIGLTNNLNFIENLQYIVKLSELAEHALRFPAGGVVADVGQFKLPKQEMVASLAGISGLSDWKLNRKDGSIILWIEVTGKPDDKVVALITAANIAKQISVKRVDKNPNNWVIQCVDVDPKKLCNVSVASASSAEANCAGKI